jgi:hypothetical protein
MNALMRNRFSLASVLLLAPLVLPRAARADSVAETDTTYLVQAEGSTVTVSLSDSYSDFPCGGSTPLLRQDEATGAAVELTSCDGGGDYVDECVPPGTYRYGLATPPQCKAGIADIAFFGEVTVSSVLSPSCVRTSGHMPPVAYSGALPWGDAAGDAGVTTGITCPASCACRAASTFDKGVLSLQMFAVATGLAMMRRRTRRRLRTAA